MPPPPPQTESPTATAKGTGAIVVQGLRKSFGSNQALKAMDLTIEPGSIVGLIGPNGSGKSTFMRCLIGLCRADAGRVWVDGLALKGDGANVRQRLTYAPGEMGVYREMRAKDHLDWLLRGRDQEARERARALAEELKLPLERRVGRFSHGMKRQLIFAAAMAPKVPVRILDEITEGLDPSKRTQVTDVLGRDSENGTTILLSSHHFGEVDRACQRILFMQAGSVLEDTQADAVRERAARLLRIAWQEPGRAQEFLDQIPAASYRHARLKKLEESDTQELVLELNDTDPRSVLQALSSMPEAPRTLQFGATTLQDLYRDLYGVEGT